MVTINNLNKLITALALELKRVGVVPEKIILFGSYAKGHPHNNSDIDIAVWSRHFSGMRLLDIERVAPVISKFSDLQLHPFAMDDTAQTNPFVEEIERTGMVFDLTRRLDEEPKG